MVSRLMSPWRHAARREPVPGERQVAQHAREGVAAALDHLGQRLAVVLGNVRAA